MPKLVIVRHGQANPGADHDAERTLTPAGEKEALLAGEWLAGVISAGRLNEPQLLSSPYRRAMQTAEFINRSLDVQMQLASWLTPDTPPLTVADQIINASSDLILVSHQPLVGRIDSLMVDGQDLGQMWATAECHILEADLFAPGCMQLLSSWYPRH